MKQLQPKGNFVNNKSISQNSRAARTDLLSRFCVCQLNHLSRFLTLLFYLFPFFTVIFIITLLTLFVQRLDGKKLIGRSKDGKRIKCHGIEMHKCFEPFFGLGKRPDATRIATTEAGFERMCK